MRSTLTRVASLLTITVTVFVIGGLTISLTPAAADATLCSGANYSTCTNVGYTDHGYSAHTSTSYWGAYTGHNCTNYVAYAEQTVNGAPTPSYQLGDASSWDDNASAHGVAVNATPARGSVAQWNTPSPSGHVAYVEAVNVDGSITISQDVYNAGPFSWKTISPGSSGWPNNFIHFADLLSNPPSATVDTTTISYNGGLHTFFYDPANGNLRHGWTTPTVGWQFENLDGDPGSIGHWNANVGQEVSAVVYGDSLQLFYYDATNGNLRHAWTTPTTGWQFENLDGDPGSIGHWNADVGRGSTATVYGDSLQLFYYDATNGNLRHAWAGSSGWSFENLDGDPGSIGHWNADLGRDPTAITYFGSLQLFYYDVTNGNLRHAWAGSSGWSFENLDGDQGSIGHWNADVGRGSTATVYGDSLQLLYYDATNGNLRHAWTGSTGWSFENLDGDPGSIGHWNADLGRSSTATVYGDSLQLFYYDATNGNLRHAWTGSTGWSFENLDGDPGSIGHRDSHLGTTQATTGYGDSLHVFYPDTTYQTYRHAWASSTGWQFEDLTTLST